MQVRLLNAQPKNTRIHKYIYLHTTCITGSIEISHSANRSVQRSTPSRLPRSPPHSRASRQASQQKHSRTSHPPSSSIQQQDTHIRIIPQPTTTEAFLRHIILAQSRRHHRCSTTSHHLLRFHHVTPLVKITQSWQHCRPSPRHYFSLMRHLK